MIRLFGKSVGYSKVPHQGSKEESEIPGDYDASRNTIWSCCFITGTVALIVLAATLGFHAGRHTQRGAQCENQQAPFISNLSKTFISNITFSSPPSPETNRAWESLYPEGRGFLKDPQNRLEVVGVSLFHQLHCLDLLRHAYYATTPEDLSSEHPSEDHRQHAKHCIDYLRQALMCAADGTLEPGDKATHFITGMNVVHTCRDYDGLRKWSEARQLTADDMAKWSAPM